MSGPNLRFTGRTTAAGCEERPHRGQMLGLYEQFGEGRVGDVGGLRRQRQFDAGRHIDLPGDEPRVGQRDASHLRVVLG